MFATLVSRAWEVKQAEAHKGMSPKFEEHVRCLMAEPKHAKKLANQGRKDNEKKHPTGWTLTQVVPSTAVVCLATASLILLCPVLISDLYFCRSFLMSSLRSSNLLLSPRQTLISSSKDALSKRNCFLSFALSFCSCSRLRTLSFNFASSVTFASLSFISCFSKLLHCRSDVFLAQSLSFSASITSL